MFLDGLPYKPCRDFVRFDFIIIYIYIYILKIHHQVNNNVTKSRLNMKKYRGRITLKKIGHFI
jgi:hypothetical protein